MAGRAYRAHGSYVSAIVDGGVVAASTSSTMRAARKHIYCRYIAFLGQGHRTRIANFLSHSFLLSLSLSLSLTLYVVGRWRPPASKLLQLAVGWMRSTWSDDMQTCSSAANDDDVGGRHAAATVGMSIGERTEDSDADVLFSADSCSEHPAHVARIQMACLVSILLSFSIRRIPRTTGWLTDEPS